MGFRTTRAHTHRLAFSYCWQFVEGIITLHHHVQGFCFSSPDRGNHLDVTEYPPATAIIVAYLPNEADIIMETLAHFKSLSYAGGLEVRILIPPASLSLNRNAHQRLA